MNASDLFKPQDYAKMTINGPTGDPVVGPDGTPAYLNVYPSKGTKGEEAGRLGLGKFLTEKGNSDPYDVRRVKLAKLAAHYVHDGFLPDEDGANLLPQPFTKEAKESFLKPLHMEFLVDQIFTFANEPSNFLTKTNSSNS